jgi:toxin ParE1/3/4
MLKITIRPQASLDIEDHVTYLAEQNEDRAFRFFDSVRETFADLAQMPGIGRRYLHPTKPDLNLHRWAVRNFCTYLVFYRIRETEIEIVRVLPAVRDLDSILGRESP